MVHGRRDDRFSFLDLPGALWYFLGEERWMFLGFSGVLVTVLCYTMVPSYIVGLIAVALALRGAPLQTNVRPS